MEGWIIREGFEYLYELGLPICKYIADADSHTFSLLKTLPWGEFIEKIDCSNHLMRNFTTFITKWKKDNKVKVVNDTWVRKFAKCIHLLIKTKIENKQFFKKHMS